MSYQTWEVIKVALGVCCLSHLAGTIGAQEAKALPTLDAQRQALDSHLEGGTARE